MIKGMTTASFIAGLIPAVVLFILYAWKTPWRVKGNTAGRAMFLMILVFAASYGLSVIVLVAPGLFDDTSGQWIRIILRLAIAAVLWNLLRLFLTVQRRARDDERIHNAENDIDSEPVADRSGSE